ncbi:hypothetical protein GUITHDRAFT_118859 [Guillardia theta CCMP2712]|uniref:Uncharacterized protein n=1 Tax=Guillardia theta (strain CCMP2712) TaxID=905079 RepID=L1IGG6_GUITC|nr:hypothetical protein GUITHDRAFT_118859 [Guillardia theta CCMP2712]EKX34925.1 hypothetical protein GUITHDRAFT_118859 [Guillardia theta CCMP2712]|eukprot:XP_005821905.1 hypothetical protein GUITHDRAFT_118859 [Guillardia theta CCMP2712]
MAFRATKVLLGVRLPDYSLPSQAILRAIQESGPLTVAQLWEKMSQGDKFKTKNHMKRVIDVLREQQRVVAKPVDRTVKRSPHAYHLGLKPKIVDANGNLIEVNVSKATSGSANEQTMGTQ